MQLKDVMTENVNTVESTRSVRDAAKIMAERDVGFLPVLHEGVAAGVVTDRDIAVRVVAQGLDPVQTSVIDAMSERAELTDRQRDSTAEYRSAIVTLPEETEVEAAIRLMDDEGVRRILVHDAEYRVTGVVSRSDLPDKAAVE